MHGFATKAWTAAKTLEHKIAPVAKSIIGTAAQLAPQYSKQCPECAAGAVALQGIVNSTDKYGAAKSALANALPQHADIVNHMGDVAKHGYDAYNSYVPTEGGNAAMGRVKAAATRMYAAQQSRNTIEQSGHAGPVPVGTEQMDAVRRKVPTGKKALTVGPPSHNPLNQDIGLFGARYGFAHF